MTFFIYSYCPGKPKGTEGQRMDVLKVCSVGAENTKITFYDPLWINGRYWKFYETQLNN